MTTPDYMQPLVGWRKFNLRHAGSLLVSANHPTPWPSRQSPEACCIRDDLVAAYYPDLRDHAAGDPCPQQTCTCGYYAFKDRLDAEVHEQGCVLAKVALWGRVVIHQRGYRAQWLRVDALHFSPGMDVAFTALTARYDVPIFQEREPWTSEKPNAPLSSNLLNSQLQRYRQILQLPQYANQFQAFLQPLNPSRQGLVQSMPPSSGFDPRYVVIGLDDQELLKLQREVTREQQQRAHGKKSLWKSFGRK